jgi:glucosamine-6-phosphate isomerase
MQKMIFKDYHTLSVAAAKEILGLISAKPDAVLCLAAGDTPSLAYRLLPNMAAEEHVDFSRCTFVGLDEWIGIPPDNPGSCHYFLTNNLFTPLGIKPSQIKLFNALASDPVSECRKMDETIKTKGGIDLMLVGVGMNGHVGFNEPGVPMDLYSHVVKLDATTTTVGQKYFKQSTPLEKGITLGLQHFLESRKAIMVVSGTKKSSIVRDALQGEITTSVPASVIRKHHNGIILLDEEAAEGLRPG